MMSTLKDNSEFTCHLYEGSEVEKNRLKELCLTWDFWSYDEVLKALSSNQYLLIYAAQTNQSWSGALLLNRGPYSTDVMYIFVSRSQRQQGIGRQLLSYFK